MIIYDNLTSGYAENIGHLKQIKFVRGDVCDFELLAKETAGVDTIFHLAEYLPNFDKFGEGHVVKFSSLKPLADLQVSTGGTISVLEAARKNNCQVVFASTAAVYGNQDKVLTEETELLPASPYGASKLAAEIYCGVYARLYGLNIKAGRIFNSYGPNQRKYFLYDFMQKVLSNEPEINLLGNGEQERDFIFVKDTAGALARFSELKDNQMHVFNICTGRATKIKELITEIVKIKSITKKINFSGSSWTGDVTKLVGSNEKLKSIGFIPKYDLQSGLREALAWFD